MDDNRIQQMIKQFQVVLLDGAMATEIEKKGLDIKDDLWSAKAIIDTPDLIKEVHLDYFKAGADIATTNTYQANIEGFKKHGWTDEDARHLMTKAVLLAKEARDEFWTSLTKQEKLARPYPLVAGSIGPYGAFLADGSEYTGKYDLSIEEFQQFHLSRMKLLKEAGIDIFAFETIPHFHESMALAQLLETAFPDTSAWISFSIANDQQLCDGTALDEAASYFNQHSNICAIGVNCTSVSRIPKVISNLKNVTTKPIIIYPNSGEQYDPQTKSWSKEQQYENFGVISKDWYKNGASLIGGCCRTTPKDIRHIKEWARDKNMGDGSNNKLKFL
ncbi:MULTISPECIES: homocysteine S-methyltransferase [Bacillus]|uniref:S-methylmethionine:homocysteine methyltransferase n=2 Tax=Bacillus TaxID=1386 RepID=A0A0M4FDZ7_9BACI|nr:MULTISPECIES: homocysteine S-methyltransferase [Bacillus]ALC80274.1 homocysteine methyltransferase [Bacillus gobiensis]MBP1083894.1 homocysteine S-methyltransferase [Bacillus capparidis]MED1098375.1 homocysteine S-methyltransferase [Bacillus capparidis]